MDKVMLVILDGYGLAEESKANAAYLAQTPFIDSLLGSYPASRLRASGEDVGLPSGQIGNSEVGHLNIGAGRIVYQDLTRINKSIESGEFFTNQALNEAFDGAKARGKNLHLLGLVSKGGVHSSFDHLLALLDMAKRKEFTNIYIHCFLDGRDVLPQSGYEDMAELYKILESTYSAQVSTIVGRYYAMDRDKRWDRVKVAYDAMVLGLGEVSSNPLEDIKASYNKGINDEFLRPLICQGERIREGDSLIFFNFRADRAREMTLALTDPDFKEFKTNNLNLDYTSMTEYDKTYDWVKVAYRPEDMKNTLGTYLADHGAKQLRLAETEKYAHVTFFFNGGVEEAFPGEYRVLISSPKVATYDEKPAMSAEELTDMAISKIRKDRYDFITLNYANPDMVGHTGKMDATIKALEALDKQVERLVSEARSYGYEILVTADHGNCEQMLEPGKDSPYTAHTTNEVPIVLISDKEYDLGPGRLANIAPTILELMGLEKPIEMTEESLLRRK